jgi:hypothetical protein
MSRECAKEHIIFKQYMMNMSIISITHNQMFTYTVAS